MTRNHEGSSFDQERAEALGEGFDDYRVHLGHWPELAQAFRDAYQPVWVRAMSRVLLVCGPQGSGKSLFCRRLAQDHAATLKALERDGTVTPDLENNLWHLLVVDRKDNAAEVIAETTRQTEIRPIRERTGWLDDLTRWGQENKSKVRVLVFDNFHRERFLSELGGIPLDAYLRRREEGRESGILPVVAQTLVSIARGELIRSVFVCLANDTPLMESLVEDIRREHYELPALCAVPLPEAREKERIVRTNLNRLNAVSYWYCLDRATPDARRPVRSALVGREGVGRVYQLVEDGIARPRPGAPATPNRLTVVTLGSHPAEVSAKLTATWESTPPEAVHVGSQVGAWTFRGGFARALGAKDPSQKWRCELFDSEFTVRWIALGMKATRALVESPPGQDGAVTTLLALVTGDESGLTAEALVALDEGFALGDDEPAWGDEFRARGQGRSQGYEAALREHMRAMSLPYSTAMPAHPALRPDVTIAPYAPCALSEAEGDEDDELRDALRRRCHAVEFTSHLREGLDRIDGYLLDKVIGYAMMLEEL